MYLFPFLYGYLIASDRRFEAALRRVRRPALAGALVATVALVVWAGPLGESGADVRNGGVPALSALQGLAGWLWIVSILGFAGSLMARGGGQSAIVANSPPGRPGPRDQSP